MRLSVCRSESVLATRAARYMHAVLNSALARRGEALIALSGGRTPWPTFDALLERRRDWSRVTIAQVDERVVVPDDPARTWPQIAALLEQRVDRTCFPRLMPMPVDEKDLEAAAERYAVQLADCAPRIDLLQLGLGADGHTASLLPGDPLSRAHAARIGISAAYQGSRRMTLGLATLRAADRIVWLVRGRDKRAALAALLAGQGDSPAICLGRTDAVVFADHEAVAGLDLEALEPALAAAQRKA